MFLVFAVGDRAGIDTHLHLLYPDRFSYDLTADMCRFLHVVNEIKPHRPDFSILLGREELIVPALFMRADGGTLSTAGVAPEAIMRI